jgi:hypothetical protein
VQVYQVVDSLKFSRNKEKEISWFSESNTIEGMARMFSLIATSPRVNWKVVLRALPGAILNNNNNNNEL